MKTWHLFAMILQAKITEKENNDFILNDLKESCEEGNIETQNDSAVLLYSTKVLYV